MKLLNKKNLLMLGAACCLAMTFSCNDKDDDAENLADESGYIGKAVGNFSAEEWYVGGQLGTTDNVTAGCYEDETLRN